MKALTAIILAILVLSGSAGTNDVLTSVRAVAERSKEQTIRPASFDLTATVSSALIHNGRLNFLTLTDGTTYLFLMADNSITNLFAQPGDRARVRGAVRWARPNMPAICCHSLEVLSHGPPPMHRPADIIEVLSGRIDWKPACVSGLVRDVLPSETNENWTILLLCADGETLYVSVYTENPKQRPFDALLGKTVDVCGFANPQTGSRRSYAGRVFHCPDPARIRVHRSTTSPFAAPVISTLRNLEPRQIAAFGRTRVKGRILACWGNGEALIETKAKEIVHVKTDTTPLPPRGSSVEVSGFPTSDLFHLTLSHALWRKTKTIKLPSRPAKRITAPQILSPNLHRPSFNAAQHGRMVRLRAVVRDIPEDIRPNGTIYVEDSGYTVPIDISALDGMWREIVPGSMIDVTGTCILETDDWSPSRTFPQIRGFRIVVHDADGLRVISRPPWWNATRLWTFVLTLCAVLVAIFIWNLALHRAAARKGQELLHEQIGRLGAQMKAEERTRLAVELHDSLAQNLTGISLEIDTAGRVADSDSAALKEHLGIAARTLKSCRDELRNCLWDLRNNALEAHTMDEAIRQTLAPHVLGIELTVRFNLPRERLSDNTAHTILTVIRELVLNAIRHGKASKIQVAGIDDNGTLAFSVRDNGTGFDPKTAPGVLQGHYGLLGIQERIEAFEGEFRIDSAPGAGTKATIRIHLAEKERT